MIRELGPGESGLAHLAMLALRPRIGDRDAFARRVDEVQRREGYRLVAAFAGEEQAIAVAGFRTGHFLAWGHALYCDDLSTRPEYRGRGHAGALLDWLVGEGRRLGCEGLHLDSGVGPDRADAHRLYLSKRMRITSHHFALALWPDPAGPPR